MIAFNRKPQPSNPMLALLLLSTKVSSYEINGRGYTSLTAGAGDSVSIIIREDYRAFVSFNHNITGLINVTISEGKNTTKFTKFPANSFGLAITGDSAIIEIGNVKSVVITVWIVPEDRCPKTAAFITSPMSYSIAGSSEKNVCIFSPANRFDAILTYGYSTYPRGNAYLFTNTSYSAPQEFCNQIEGCRVKIDKPFYVVYNSSEPVGSFLLQRTFRKHHVDSAHHLCSAFTFVGLDTQGMFNEDSPLDAKSLRCTAEQDILENTWEDYKMYWIIIIALALIIIILVVILLCCGCCICCACFKGKCHKKQVTLIPSQQAYQSIDASEASMASITSYTTPSYMGYAAQPTQRQVFVPPSNINNLKYDGPINVPVYRQQQQFQQAPQQTQVRMVNQPINNGITQVPTYTVQLAQVPIQTQQIPVQTQINQNLPTVNYPNVDSIPTAVVLPVPQRMNQQNTQQGTTPVYMSYPNVDQM